MIPVLVLNLPRDAERLRRMDVHLRSLGVAYAVAHGVDGRTVPDDEAIPHLTAFRKGHGREMTRGELGCALAYQQLFRRIADGPDPFVCVIEDDIDVLPTISPFLEETTLGRLPRFDVLRLFSNAHRQHKPAWEVVTLHGHSVVAPLRTGWGTYSQVFTRDGARKLVNLPTMAPIDSMMYYRCPPFGLRIFEVRPSLVRLLDFGSNTANWQTDKSLLSLLKTKVRDSLRVRLHFVMTWGLPGLYGLIRSRYRAKSKGQSEVSLS